MSAYSLLEDHPFLVWCALWLGWGVVLVAIELIGVSARLLNRLLRTIKVACRGWPPSHLDADGDWPPPPKDKNP